MRKIGEQEFAHLCAGIGSDRKSILKHNPIGTRDETLLWMLLGCLISYLSLEDIETPCFTGIPDVKTYRNAILFVIRDRKSEEFNAEKYLDQLLEKMIIQQFVLTPFQQNTRVVACEETGKAICIDPGEESAELTAYIRDNVFELQAIALTHGHLDHIGGVSFLHAQFPDARIILHKDDEDLYYGLPQQPLFMGIQPHQMKELGFDYATPPKLSRNWINGEIYAVGNLRFKVLHCPGHTPGHVVLAEEKERKVYVGDCLFEGSVGRTDLPGGNFERLMSSIHKNILSLGDDFTVYSGHGPETTIGREKSVNQFLNGSYLAGRGSFL